MDKERTTPFTIRITESMKKDLESIARQEDRSVNYIINRALQEYIRQYNDTDNS